MLWAIDVGNTHTVVGVGSYQNWPHVWRIQTDPSRTEDELAALFGELTRRAGLDVASVSGCVVASVVPAVNLAWAQFSRSVLGCSAFQLSGASANKLGIKVQYEPPQAVGADRLANALAMTQREEIPAIVVDFGTATTFDAVGPAGEYLGGAIFPGVETGLTGLVGRTAKLPQIALEVPEHAVGAHTTEALQSGLLFGNAGAVDRIIEHMKEEMGSEGIEVVSTGGLGAKITPLCQHVTRHEPWLTLDGLAVAGNRLGLLANL